MSVVSFAICLAVVVPAWERRGRRTRALGALQSSVAVVGAGTGKIDR